MNDRVVGTALFIGRRVVGAVGTMLALATVVFFLLKAIPGDEAVAAAGESATPEQVAAIRHQLGLDRSIVVQYFDFLGRLGRGDLGTSSSTHGSVASSIADLLPGTAELVVVSIVLSVVLSVPLAAWSAIRDSGAGESFRRVTVIVLAGMPTFWLALMLHLINNQVIVMMNKCNA